MHNTSYNNKQSTLDSMLGPIIMSVLRKKTQYGTTLKNAEEPTGKTIVIKQYTNKYSKTNAQNSQTINTARSPLQSTLNHY